jgi:hypothetical protein
MHRCTIWVLIQGLALWFFSSRTKASHGRNRSGADRRGFRCSAALCHVELRLAARSAHVFQTGPFDLVYRLFAVSACYAHQVLDDVLAITLAADDGGTKQQVEAVSPIHMQRHSDLTVTNHLRLLSRLARTDGSTFGGAKRPYAVVGHVTLPTLDGEVPLMDFCV